MADHHDVAIVGAGIVGLATALALLQRRPSLRLAVLEKEAQVGQHQTGHNSGVVHSGIYYRPGSTKARLCADGRRRLLEFCAAQRIPVKKVGKLIVATRKSELPGLQELQRRGAANGVEGVAWLTSEQLGQKEPEVRGIAALDVPTAAIVDYGAVARSLAAEVTARGGEVRVGTAVRSIERPETELALDTPSGEVRTRFLVNCAGLQSDRVARLAGLRPGVRIVPFRGEFYEVCRSPALAVDHLVYPVPDPRLPFLGVHLTLTLRGTLTAGPNAVLSGAREGYDRSRISGGDLLELGSFPGFWRMSRRWWRTGAYEQLRSLSRAQFADDLRRMVPGLAESDLRPGGAGVRAQAVDRAGELVDDFVFVGGPGSLHVLNAPSPAATSSLAIAQEIAERVPSSL